MTKSIKLLALGAVSALALSTPALAQSAPADADEALDADEPLVSHHATATAASAATPTPMNNGVFDDPAPADARCIRNCIGSAPLPASVVARPSLAKRSSAL